MKKLMVLCASICLMFLFAGPNICLSAENEGCYLGVFREGAPQNMAFISSFQKSMGKKPAVVMWYVDWSSDFPLADCNNVEKYGSIPHIVWEPWIWGDEKKITLDTIINGEWDDYIKSWAQGAKSFNKTIFLRCAHEFNIEKYPWGVGNNGKDPAKYVLAYKHIHDIFNKVGATNVKWIWCFNNYNNPDEDWNAWDKAYPGDEYVDWIGIDGYNWGSTQSWSGWQTFKDCFRDQIRDAVKKFPGKPVMIAEFGSAEQGGNKADWVKEIPGALEVSMRSVKAIMLFDVRKECDWRSTSCQATENAYKYILKDPYFLSNPDGMDTLTVPVVEAVKKVVTAKKVSKPVKIDGSFAPFASAKPIIMADKSYFQEGNKWNGVKDLSAKIYMLWDNSFLYIYAKVNDKMPLTNSRTKGDIWNGDAIEVCLPGYQIGLGTGDGKANKPSIWIWQKNKASVEGKIFSKKVSSPLKGYVMEARIPWKELGFFDPTQNNTIPFDIAIDDSGPSWTREKQFVWSGDYLFYKDPDVWGELRLVN